MTFITRLTAAQQSNRQRSGKYFQVPPTHREVPAQGRAVAPSQNRTKQEDEPAGLIDAIPADFSTEVHEHVGPDGPGYTIYERQKRGRAIYQRATGTGAHSHNYDWLEEDE